MSIKRNHNDSLNECETYMKRMKLSHKSPIKKVNNDPNKEIIDNIKESEKSLHIKIKTIEDSVTNRLNHLDTEVKNINEKLDQLINIVTNSFFEKPLYNHQNTYVS